MRVYLTAAYAWLARSDDAEWQLAELLTLNPDLTVGAWVDRDILADRRDAEHLAEGLRRAGLPE